MQHDYVSLVTYIEYQHVGVQTVFPQANVIKDRYVLIIKSLRGKLNWASKMIVNVGDILNLEIFNRKLLIKHVSMLIYKYV